MDDLAKFEAELSQLEEDLKNKTKQIEALFQRIQDGKRQAIKASPVVQPPQRMKGVDDQQQKPVPQGVGVAKVQRPPQRIKVEDSRRPIQRMKVVDDEQQKPAAKIVDAQSVASPQKVIDDQQQKPAQRMRVVDDQVIEYARKQLQRQADQKVFRGERGIGNAGNTCFANSVIQLLRACPELFHVHPVTFDQDPRWANFINNINPNLPHFPPRPEVVVDAIRSCDLYERGVGNVMRQQDAHEFLMRFLDKSENNTLFKPRVFEIALRQEDKILADNDQCLDHRKRTKTTLELILQVQVSRPVIYLGNAIAEFLSTEYITDPNNLRDFGNSVDGKDLRQWCRSFGIMGIDRYVIVQAKIFTNDLRKLPNRLIPDREVRIGGHRCEPVSIVCHIGQTMNSGHYTNLTKKADAWYYFNDDMQPERFQDFQRFLYDHRELSPYLILLKNKDYGHTPV